MKYILMTITVLMISGCATWQGIKHDTKEGAHWTKEKVHEGAKWTKEKVHDGANYVEKKTE